MIENKLEVTNLLKPLINTFKTISDEWKHLFSIGISEYLQSQTEKYYFTNTFIHRSEKVKFTDVYFPLKATYKKLKTDFLDLETIFGDYKNITLIGTAGSGKTTLLKHIFLQCITERKKIPIIIELRNLNDYDGDFEKLISEKVLNSKVKPNDSTFKRTLRSGDFLFLLDGYDEVFSDKKQEINRQIETFMDSYSQNNLLITTRPGSGIEGFARFYDFNVSALEDSDVKGFIEKIVQDQERKSRILSIAVETKDSNYIEYLRNPLLLSMFIMAFENHPEIPSKKSSFYRNVFDTLYSKHDGVTKSSFPREKLTKFQREEFEDVLNIFCYISYFEGKYSFTEEYLTDTFKKVKKITEYNFKIEDLIYDLRTTISILVLDGFEYHFPHRSLQEYFTAQFISQLPSQKKLKAYNNLLILEKSSNDYSLNLWAICNELDEIAFISKFLLPNLRKFKKIFLNKTDNALFDTYVKVVNIIFYYGRYEKNDKKGITILRMSSTYTALNNFCDIVKIIKIGFFPRNSGCENDLLALLRDDEKAETNFPVPLLQNPKTKEILFAYNICEIIKEEMKLLSEKILFYERKMERTKDKINDLLNL